MANPQLVQYIHDTMAKGVAHDTLTKMLADAGWSPAEVQEAFGAIAAPTAAAPAQHMTTEDFLAEMERRRKEAEASKPVTPAVLNDPQIVISPSPATSEKGLIGLVLKTGLVKTKEQANAALIIILVVVVGLIAWVNFK